MKGIGVVGFWFWRVGIDWGVGDGFKGFVISGAADGGGGGGGGVFRVVAASGDRVERESGGGNGVRLAGECRTVVWGVGSKGKVIHNLRRRRV